MIPLHDDNPTKTVPLVTVTIIIAATLIFFYQISLGQEGGQLFVYQYGAIPAAVFGYESLPREAMAIPTSFTLITSMFLHGGFMHLIGNMLYLWIFGNNIEDVMGHVRFIVFYLVCGVAAAMSHALTAPDSVVPMIGASGAISGVLGAYLLLYPRAHVLVLIPLGLFTRLVYIPAGFVLGFWFVLQLISVTASAGSGGGGVAWFAHIGGFVAGMLLIGLFKHRSVRFFNPSPRRPSRYDSSW
ncbi:MAG TPA: rhomboid family intramembrane serine protease [Nitrospiria bacterium]|nr:rhomboid family intramembrane serine protease [Nitrospiria bacterium]